MCCQDLKGLPSEIKKRFVFKGILVFSFLFDEMSQRKKADPCRARQTFPSYSTVFPLLFKYSCCSLWILLTKADQEVLYWLFLLRLICVDGFELKLLEGFCSLNFDPLVASNMSATMSAPHSSRGCCAITPLAFNRGPGNKK